MTSILQGVRVLEVAEHTFVPAAPALLADWGADVIKIEHVQRGPGRAHEFNEHGDDILADLGIDWDTVVDLKVKGVVA